MRDTRPLLYFTTAILVTAVGLAWLASKGELPLLRGSTPIAEDTPFWYTMSSFPILGLLVAELISVLVARREVPSESIELALGIAGLLAIAGLRVGLHLPVSGHASLYGYFVARRALADGRLVPAPRLELLAGSALLLQVTWTKLAWWNDPKSLASGLAAGGSLFLIGLLLRQRRRGANE